MSQYIIDKVFYLFHKRSDPLVKNSFFLILTSISSAAFGFAFWAASAKMYNPEDVGIATAIISSMGLLTMCSKVGLDYSIIRFIPTRNKNNLLSTSIIITTFLVLLFAILFVLKIDLISPKIVLLKSPFYSIFFLLFVMANSLYTVTSISFVGMRKAKLQFLQSLFVGLRVPLLFLFLSFGAMGIFSSTGFSFIFAFLIGIVFYLHNGIKLKLNIDKSFLVESIHFSIGNYAISLLITAPNLILPVIVLNVLGTEETAYYYIAFSIASFLFMIPNTISTSLFVEGSHGEQIRNTVLKSLVLIFSLLIPLCIVLYFTGGELLEIIGKDYSANGIELLRLMIISSFFISIVAIYTSIKRIQKEMTKVVILSGVIFSLLIGLSYFLMQKWGLLGIGYAWITSYCVGSFFVCLMILKEDWFRIL